MGAGWDAKTTLSPHPTGWAANASDADLSTTESLVAAPGAGKSLYVTSVSISNFTANEVLIGAGESANSIETIVFGPIYTSIATGWSTSKRFVRPLKLPENKALTVQTLNDLPVTVYAEGYTDSA